MSRQSEAGAVTVEVRYLGPVARLTGRECDRFTLTKGSSAEDLLEAVLSRHTALLRHKNSLFMAVNNTALPAHPPARRARILAEGDRVIVGVKVVGG